jgi:pyruvate, orthophosphate dikinase
MNKRIEPAMLGVILDGTNLPDRQLVGGKAWSVARMQALGLPVPPAFVLTTAACREYLSNGRLTDAMQASVRTGIAHIERASGRKMGCSQRPLLVSVRSGAPVSMPGMMDTVLNLGINDATEAALAQETGSARFARDTHRRFCEMFARIVMRSSIEALPVDVDPAQWRQMIADSCQHAMPTDPFEQLTLAINAIFDSWNGRRAKRYREHHGIDHTMGTAVTIQAMVFGNSDHRSGTGVLFTRNPLSGEATPYGEYLECAQGEDVVSGSHTPLPLERLRETLPEVHAQLMAAAATLERENRDVQDIEFTIERGQLYLLQSRSAKRSPAAALRAATDMVREGRIDVDEALRRVTSEQVRLLLRPRLCASVDAEREVVLARGEAASPGAGFGIVVDNADDAERLAQAGQAVVLARPTTSPEDVHGMFVAQAVITERGGSTSHAAVVSRQLGVPCVVGCGDGALKELAGRSVTIDGTRGLVFAGRLAVEQPQEDADPLLRQLRDWARARSPLRVYAVGQAPHTPDVDLESDDLTQAAPRLGKVRSAVGSILNTDEGVQLAVAAGLDFIVVKQALPALLAACACANISSPRSAAINHEESQS